MQTIYAVLPFVSRDRLPVKGTIERLIFDNEYFFVGYSDSLLYVRKYMDFIDNLLGNVFSKLNYQIINYKYPDYLEGHDSDIIRFINKRYRDKLMREQAINRISVTIPYSEKTIDVYLNDMMYYGKMMDYASLGNEMVDDAGYFETCEVFEYVNRSKDTEAVFELIDVVGDIVSNIVVDDRICNDYYAIYELYIQVMRRLPFEKRR